MSEELPAPKASVSVTRQAIHDEIVRQTGQEFYSPPLHGGVTVVHGQVK